MRDAGRGGPRPAASAHTPADEAAQESNLPTDGLRRPARFEDAIRHQTVAAPQMRVAEVGGAARDSEACERVGVDLPDALRIAVSNTVGASWQLDLTSAAIAADPDAWTDNPVEDPEPVIGPMLAIGSLLGPVLRYREWDEGGLVDVAIYQPDADVWRRFDEALRRLRVWEWQSPPGAGAFDGGAWAVGLIWERRTIDIQGIGAWPPHHTTVPGPEWTGFMRAVHRLAGRRGFDPHMLREDV